MRFIFARVSDPDSHDRPVSDKKRMLRTPFGLQGDGGDELSGGYNTLSSLRHPDWKIPYCPEIGAFNSLKQSRAKKLRDTVPGNLDILEFLYFDIQGVEIDLPGQRKYKNIKISEKDKKELGFDLTEFINNSDYFSLLNLGRCLLKGNEQNPNWTDMIDKWINRWGLNIDDATRNRMINCERGYFFMIIDLGHKNNSSIISHLRDLKLNNLL